MNTQLLIVGEDAFFGSSELTTKNFVHVASQNEALSLIAHVDFQAIIARDGGEILKVLRAQGKHTPFLNISNSPTASDCCGGHMSPGASSEEKAQVLARLMARNHDLDCL